MVRKDGKRRVWQDHFHKMGRWQTFVLFIVWDLVLTGEYIIYNRELTKNLRPTSPLVLATAKGFDGSTYPLAGATLTVMTVSKFLIVNNGLNHSHHSVYGSPFPLDLLDGPAGPRRANVCLSVCLSVVVCRQQFLKLQILWLSVFHLGM